MPVPPLLPELDLLGWFARLQHAIAFARKLLSGDAANDAVGFEVRND
jgi:hypothetical protein